MTELRVPTVALDAEVLCADGQTFHGRVFLPAAASKHSGAMRPQEWMNDGMLFFPFLPDEGGPPFILNKHEVLVLSVEAGPDSLEMEKEIEETAIRRRVIVECREKRIEGVVLIDMPANLSRTVDYLNRPDPFLIVREGSRQHLIRKARITRVIEPREE